MGIFRSGNTLGAQIRKGNMPGFVSGGKVKKDKNPVTLKCAECKARWTPPAKPTHKKKCSNRK